MKNYTFELSSIINKLKEQGKMNFMPKATDDHIYRFEKINSVILPSQYKAWLLFSDGGDLFLPAGVQLYGVSHLPLIDVNNKYVPNNRYIVIGALASGDQIIFSKGEDQVSIFNHETEKINYNESFADFFTFLTNLSEFLGL